MKFKNLMTMVVILAALIAPFKSALAQVDIATQPVFGDISMPPNLLINLSVEFPTVGSAYRSISYTPGSVYLGYFNPNRCYAYNTTNKHFISNADTVGTNRTCTGAFSGNYLNYVTMSAIDTFRYGLTGGNRIVDTQTKTVLQRASLPTTFYNSSSNFPSRSLNSGTNIAPNLVTPFTSTTVYIANCGTSVYFGTANTGTCASPGNNANLGTYEVAVQVCDSGEGVSRNDLCSAYGDNYKPVGEIQRNALKMRFGVMGYLIDNTRTRYGGVLRAPMKYTGEKEITITGAKQENSKKEWDKETGVFAGNPEGATENISGVINYINKFGSVSGYKTYDPIGELYYEGLRYLMGLQPTSKAVSGITTAMRDGFPVLTSWSDPMQASCQQSYTITVGDTNTWDDRELPGNTMALTNDALRAVDERGLNATTWTNAVGVLEGKTTLSSTTTGAGNAGFLLVGAAYWAHTNDIRPDPANPGKTKQIVTSYAFDVDESSSTAYKDRQLHLLAKYGSFSDANGDKNPFKTVDANGASVTNNTEWEDPGNIGFSSGYFLASNPVKMLESLRKVFSTIASDPGSGAAASPSNPNVTSGDRYVFSSRFIGSDWTGEIFRQSIDLNSGVLSASDWNTNLTIKASSLATDAVQIPTSFTTLGSDKRRIYMWDATATTNKLKDFCPSGTGIGCATSGGTAMTAAEKTYFSTSTTSVDLTQESSWTTTQKTASTSDALISYIRGRKDLEITTDISQPSTRKLYRSRKQVLGDVVNSEAIYVKQPNFNYQKAAGTAGDGYATFKATTRVPSLYVGANDGMLHSINALSGAERWAYIPPQVMPNLWKLADSGYGNTGGHRYFVDGTPTVGDIKVGTAWKTLLVGGFGAGANGFYAMDINDPTAPKAMWNICTSSTLCNVVDADMGLSFGQPIVTRVKKGTLDKWVVLVTSGHNNSSGIGYLYVLDAANGSVLAKISTGVGSATAPSGLTKVSAWTDNADTENITKFVYGGDLLGNIWRFDLSDIDTPALLKLAELKDPSGASQPVTTAPELGEVESKRVVYVGTGRLLSPSDLLTTQVQSVYALKDDNVTTTLPEIRATLGTFIKQTMTDVTVAGQTAKDVTTPLTVDWGSKNGWYVDFTTGTATGERVSVDMSLDLGTLSVVTNTPRTGVCVAGGESWIYYFNFKSGSNVVTGTTTTPFVGKKLADALGTRPVVVRLPNGKIVSIIRLTNNTTLTQDVPISTSFSVGRRINWRELTD